MRFVRFGQVGEERPGVLDGDVIVDIGSHVDDIGPSSIGSLGSLRPSDFDGLPRVSLERVRLGSPVARPGKIIGVGFNYVDHASEAKVEVPSEPIIFMKASSSISGPYDDILIPPGADKVDWEVELAVVIGTTALRLASEADARDMIAGYTIGHDVSERAHQLERGGHWTKGKSADTFCPVGPWLVTPDELDDPTDLTLECRVNGETKQSGSTSMMLFATDHLIWHLSQFMTLEPGDLILTGTPPGVGLSTGTYLRDGDVVDLEVEGLGHQRQVCRQL